MAATYTLAVTDAAPEVTVPATQFPRKANATQAADELAAAHPGVTVYVVTKGGKVVHTAVADQAQGDTPADLHVPAEGEEVRFLVAKRLADYIVRNAADYRADVVAALKVGDIHRATGKGNQVHVETSETTAKALRVVFKELHLALATGALAKVPFRTTTTDRHIDRIDEALAA